MFGTNPKTHIDGSRTVSIIPKPDLFTMTESSQYDNKKNESSSILTYKDRLRFHSDYLEFLTHIIHMPLPKLIIEYVYLYDIIFYDLAVYPKTKISNLGFFNHQEKHIIEYKKAEEIAYTHILTAGPIDILEKEIRKNPNILLPQIRIKTKLSGIEYSFKGNLLQLAIILHDHTISSTKRADKGQAELIKDLTQELLPDSMSLLLQQLHFALPSADEKIKNTEKIEQLNVSNAAFNAIKQNNSAGAREIINHYIEKTKPIVITNNRYFLRLLHFIPTAFNVLTTRGNELEGTWSGDQAEQYYFAVIGMITRVFPYKLRKILSSKLYNVLYQSENVDRDLDVSDPIFIGASGSPSELGINCFYNDTGLWPSENGRCHGWLCWQNSFQTYINNYINATQRIIHADAQLKEDTPEISTDSLIITCYRPR